MARGREVIVGRGRKGRVESRKKCCSYAATLEDPKAEEDCGCITPTGVLTGI